MAKAFIVFKTIVYVIVLITNGDCFRIATKQPNTSTENSSLITEWNHTTNDILVNDSDNKVELIGEIALKLSIFIYSCLAIALLCDEYFVPTLEKLGKVFNLPSDITGAILIPIGTSGPEIFSSAVGVFFASNDIGTGAIIGSAVFNLLAIPATCGIAVVYFIGKPVKLDELPILRDLLFYILSIIVLILVIKDNAVDLMDSSLLTLLFAIYVGVMIYNARLSMRRDNNSEIKLKKIQSNNNNSDNKFDKSQSTSLLHERAIILIEQFAKNIKNSKPTKSGYEKIGNDYSNEKEDDCGLMNNRILKIILFPFSALYFLTIPKNYSVIAFLISIGWLSGLSYFTVWSISGLSDTAHIPQTVSGMTILAMGSAIPDLVTSIIVIRKHGLASMGICAAIASNIFAIVVGLGIPWLIKCIINWSNTGDYSSSSIPIASDALPFTSILLLFTIFLFLLILKLCKWQLFKKFSVICLILHVGFMAASTCLEIFVHS